MKLFDQQTYSTFIAQFSLRSTDEDTFLQRKMTVQLHENVRLPSERISDVIERVIGDLSREELSQENEGWCRPVTIRSYNQDTGDLEYSCESDEVKQLSGDVEHPLDQLVTLEQIKEFSLYPMTTKAEPITFCEHYFQVLNDHPWLYFPIIGWLTALIWALICPAHQPDQRALHSDEILDFQKVSNPESFLRLMKLISKDAEKQLENASDEYTIALATLKHQTAGCAACGEEISEAIKNPSDILSIDILAQKYSDDIFSYLQRMLSSPEMDSLYEKMHSQQEDFTPQEHYLLQAIEDLSDPIPEILKNLFTPQEVNDIDNIHHANLSELSKEAFIRLAKLALADSYLKETGQDPAEIATIPIGYYSQDGFHPVILSFSIREGCLAVTTTNVDPSLGKKINPMQRYTGALAEGEFSQESLAQCLSVLFALQQKPENSSPEKEGKALKTYNVLQFAANKGGTHLAEARARYAAILQIQQYLDTTIDDDTTDWWMKIHEEPSLQEALRVIPVAGLSKQAVQESLNENLELHKATLDKLEQKNGSVPIKNPEALPEVAQLIDSLFINSGLQSTPSSSQLQRLVSTSEDWSKSIWIWIKEKYPALADTNKLSWETNILFNFIDSISQDSQLSLEQASAHLIAAEKAIQRLEKRYRKQFGDQEAFSKIWEENAATKTAFESLRSKISNCKGELASKRLASLNEPIARNSEWSSHLKKQGLVRDSTAAVSQPFFLAARGTLINIENTLQMIQGTENTEEASQMKALLDEYMGQCEELYQQKNYGELVDAVSAVFDKIPTPSHPLWKAIPDEEVAGWGKILSTLNQYVWEAHIKLNRSFVWPHQTLHLMNCSAIFSILMKRQADWAINELTERFAALSENEQYQLVRDAIDYAKANDCYERQWSPPHIRSTLLNFQNVRIDDVSSLLPIGKIAKELGMSQQKTLLLAFKHCQMGNEPTQFLLTQHPFLRFSTSPEIEAKALDISRNQFLEDGDRYAYNLFLDTDRWNVRDDNNRDYGFTLQIRELFWGFTGREIYTPDIWQGSWSRDRASSNDILPDLAIDLRRHNLFMQSLLHPESTLVKGFSGDSAKARWAMDLTSKVLNEDETLSTEEILRRGAEMEKEKRLQTLAQMGHFKLSGGKSAEDWYPCVHVTDEDGLELFEYQPTGPLFVDLRDPFHDASVLGKQNTLPRSYFSTAVGEWDCTDLTVASATRKRNQQSVLPLTELTILRDEKEEPSSDLDPAENAKLRSLVVNDLKLAYWSEDPKVALSTIYNTFEFIFDHPDLLEIEEIQRVLEAALTRTAVLQRALQSNPEYLVRSQIADRLGNAISYAIETDRKKAAAFLMHVSHLLKQHASFALTEMLEGNTYRELFTEIKSVSESEKFNERLASLQEACEKIPDYSSLFEVKHKEHPAAEKTSLELLVEWGKSDEVDSATRKLIYTFLLNYYRGICQTEANLEGLEVGEWVAILRAHTFVKNIGDDAGNPSIQASVFPWIKEKVLPFFEIDLDSEKKRQILGRFALREGRAVLPQWEQAGDYVYKTSDASVKVNIHTGMVQSGDESPRFETILPETVANDQNYIALFGNQRPEVNVRPSQEGNGEIFLYEFTKNDKRFLIQHHSLTQEVSILQEITINNETALYCFRSFRSELNTPESEGLFQRFGIWQNTESPQKGLVLLSSPETWTNEDVIQVDLIENEERFSIGRCRALSGKELLNDTEQRCRPAFAFAPADDILFLCEPGTSQLSEIRLLSKKISLLREPNGQWRGANQLSPYSLIQDPIRLRELTESFGEDFQRFMLPLEFIDPATDVRKSLFLTFPTVIDRPSKIDTTLNGNAQFPLLRVTVETGKVGTDEGKLKSTTAGFMNLAYQFYARKDYQRALYYLEMASASSFNVQDKEIFDAITNALRNHDDDSIRGVAFRLKAEAAIYVIERDQIGKRTFADADWKAYLEKITKDVNTFRRYQDKLNDPAKGTRKQNLIDQELVLTQEEIARFEQLIKESMEFLVDKSLEESNTPIKPPAIYRTSPLRRDQIGSFSRDLALSMTAPEADHRLESLTIYPSKTDLLSKFWAYGKQIIEESLTTSDWRIQKLQNLVLSGIPAEDRPSVNAARQFLIQLAKINETALNGNGFAARQARFEDAYTIDESRVGEYAAYDQATRELREFLDQGIHFLPDPDLYRQVTSVIQPLSQSEELSLCSLIFFMIKMFISKILSWICCNTPLEMPEQITEKLGESLQWIQDLNEKIQAVEQIITPQSPADIQQESQQQYDMSVEAVRIALNDSESPLTEQEKTIWSKLLNQLKEEDPTLERISLLKIIQTSIEMKIPLSSLRYENENIRLAHSLEARLKNPAASDIPHFEPAIIFSEDSLSIEDCKAFFETAVNECFTGVDDDVKEERLQHYQRLEENVLSYYPDDPALSINERKENERLRMSIQETADVKKQEIQDDQGTVREDRLNEMKQQLDERRRTKKIELMELKNSILQLARDNAKILPGLRQTLKHEGIRGSSEVLETMLDLYQRGKLRQPNLSDASQEVFDTLEGSLDRYLLEAIEQQQLVKACSKLPELFALKAQKQEALRIQNAATRLERLEEISIDWKEASRSLFGFLKDASRKDRYLDHTGTQLDNPAFTRKYLIAEYRSEIVTRAYQPKVLGTLIDNKNILILAKPGAGKSKLLLPKAAHLEAEKGKFVVVLVTDELINIDHQDMDPATREMSRQASHIFNFNRNTSKDVSFLIADYNRLLTAHLSKGYVMTTIGRLAALDDEIELIGEEMAAKLDVLQTALASGNSEARLSQLSDQLITLQKQRHWLSKIRALFQKEDTQYIADEVDDIFNINRDYNYAVENQRLISSTALHGAHSIMEKILGSDEEPLASLAQTLISNDQHNLNSSQITSYMKEIAKSIYHQPNAFGLPAADWTAAKGSFTEEEFVLFTTGQFEGIPEGVSKETIARLVYDQQEAFDFDPMQWADIKSRCTKDQFVQVVLGKHSPLSKEETLLIQQSDLSKNCDIKYISSLKRILTTTLPGAILNKKAGVDFGLDEDGYTVVPKRNGKADVGVRYADEYELIIFHYLYYASKAPSMDYFQSQWRKQQDRINAGIPSIWTDWYLEAGVDNLQAKQRFHALYERLQDPDCSWKQRYALLKDDVLSEKVKMYSSQVKCNSQDPLSAANVSGLSGTVNEYALPEGSERDESVHSREVMADMLLKISGMDDNFLSQHVKTYADPSALLLERARDKKCRSVIDLAASMESVDSLQIVTRLRAEGVQVQLLFIHPVYRKQWMWNPGESSPKPYDKTPLHHDCFVYIGPSEIRGTNWIIPPGNNALLVASDDEDALIQAANRCRKLGEGQNLSVYIHESVQKAHHIAREHDDLEAPIPLGDLMNDIKLRTFDQRSVNNYKAALKKIHQIIPQTVKHAIFAPYITDEEAYWSSVEEGNLKLARIFSDIACDVETHLATRDLFITKKEIVFDRDLAPSETKDTIEYLNEQFERQDALAVNLKEEISHLPDRVARRMQILAQGHDAPEHILDAAYYDGAAFNRIHALKNHVDTLTQVHGPLGQYKESFNSEQQLQRHRENLKPEVMVSAGAEASGMQELVQEQQQQQQQQQQLSVHFASRSKRNLTAAHHWKDWPKEYNNKQPTRTFFKMIIENFMRGFSHQNVPYYETTFRTLNELEGRDCGFSPHIRYSQNFKSLWQEHFPKKGELMGRFIVLLDERTQQRQVLLLDQLDYERGFAHDLNRDKNNSRFFQIQDVKVGVYSLQSNPANAELPPFFCIDGLKALPEEDTAFYEDVVQISLLAGKLFFQSPEELEALTKWAGHLTSVQKTHLKTLLAKIHKVGNVNQIPQWRSTLLAELLA